MSGVESNARRRWIRNVKWVGANVILPGVLSFVVAWFTVDSALRSDMFKGQGTFDDVGYRYFHALVALDENPSDRRAQRSYVAILKDISNDIKWLRTNPFRGEVWKDKSEQLAKLQNLLTFDTTVSDQDQISSRPQTLKLMCDLFAYSDRWKEIQSGSGVTIPEKARVICRANRIEDQ